MAVRIFEFDRKRIDNDMYSNILPLPWVAAQSFDGNAGGTARSSAFNAATRVIVVQADEKVAITVGTGTPTAAATHFQIPAGGQMPFWVEPGDVLAARTL